MLRVASVVAVAQLRALPFPRLGHALIHRQVLVDVAIVDVEEVQAGCAVAPTMTVVVDDPPAVAAGAASAVLSVRVPVVPALVAEYTRPNPHRPSHTECH